MSEVAVFHVSRSRVRCMLASSQARVFSEEGLPYGPNGEETLGSAINTFKAMLPPTVQDIVIVQPNDAPVDREDVRAAFQGCGFNVVRMLGEDLSTGYSYLRKNFPRAEKQVLFVHAGAQQTRVRVGQWDDQLYETRDVQMLDKGGDHLTERLAEAMRPRLTARQPDIEWTDRLNQQLLRAAQQTRIELSNTVTAPLEVNDVLNETVSRARLDDVSREYFNDVSRLVQTAFDNSRITGAKIDCLVLNGKLLAMPALRRLLEGIVPNATVIATDLAYGPLLGASEWASELGYASHGAVPAPRMGLFSVSGKPMRLDAVKIAGTIVDDALTAEIVQTFVNTSEADCEAYYTFPVPNGAAVIGFRVDLSDGRSVVGRVKEKKAAAREYAEAVQAGKNAYLLERVTGEAFRMSVGMLPKNITATVTIGLIAYAAIESNDKCSRLFFALPTNIAPKYGNDPMPSEGEMVHRAKVDINITCRMSKPLVNMSSPTHPVVTSVFSPQVMNVALTTPQDMDRDFVLRAETAGPLDSHLWISDDPNSSESLVMVKMSPPLVPVNNKIASKAEVIFVVDRSGSMYGDPIRKVRESLLMGLRSLPMGCRFNIVGFGSEYSSLFPATSVPYNQENLQIAIAHANRVDADYGGTEILPPLKFLLEQNTDPEYPRQILVLTDGQVDNVEAVVKLVKARQWGLRLSTMGVGDSVSHLLVDRLAAAGGGTAEYVTRNDDIRPMVMRTLRNSLQRPSTLTITANAPLGELIPSTPPPVFPGQRAAFMFRIQKGSKISFKEAFPNGLQVVLEATGGAVEWRQVVASTADSVVPGDLLPRIAAHRKITELDIPEARDEDKKAILQLALDAGLASSQTSFVAVVADRELVALPPPEKAGPAPRASAPAMQSLLLLDVTPLSLGVVDMAENSDRVILRNTTIPCRKTKTVRLRSDSSGQINVNVTEGERAKAADNHSLNQFTLSGFEADRVYPVEVVFDLDANGILNVTAEANNIRDRVTITNDKPRLSHVDIEKMVREAELYRAEDEKARALSEGKGAALNLAATVLTQLDAYGSLRRVGPPTETLRAAMQSAIAEIDASSLDQVDAIMLRVEKETKEAREELNAFSQRDTCLKRQSIVLQWHASHPGLVDKAVLAAAVDRRAELERANSVADLQAAVKRVTEGLTTLDVSDRCTQVQKHGQEAVAMATTYLKQFDEREKPDDLLVLATLQEVNGSWHAGTRLSSLLKVPFALPPGVAAAAEAVWPTLLALGFMRRTLGRQREEWELMAIKADAYVEEVCEAAVVAPETRAAWRSRAEAVAAGLEKLGAGAPEPTYQAEREQVASVAGQIRGILQSALKASMLHEEHESHVRLRQLAGELQLAIEMSRLRPIDEVIGQMRRVLPGLDAPLHLQLDANRRIIRDMNGASGGPTVEEVD